MNRQFGFTLIELVLVIVLLGILAAIGLPRMVSLSSEAEQIALKQQAEALRAQNRINIAACKLNSDGCIDIVSTGTTACEDGLANFLPGVDLNRYATTNIGSSTPRNQWGH